MANSQPGKRCLLSIAFYTCTSIIAVILSACDASAEDHLIQDTLISAEGERFHVRVFAEQKHNDEYVLLLPSLGRGVEDFTNHFGSTLTSELVKAGYRVVLMQPRGVGRSTNSAPPKSVTMKMLANDINSVTNKLNIERFHLVGHAFGNRLARTYTRLHPSKVISLSLLAAGGNFTMSEMQRQCLRDSITLSHPIPVRLSALKCAFFASNQAPNIWLAGWYPKAAMAQINAASTIDANFYKAAGGKPFLIIQGSEDFIAPPRQAGQIIKEELGEQVSYVEIENAGHALLPEQPAAVADALISYIQSI